MASIRDIAKMAGVSPASVSRILNNDESFSINENTRKRVLEIANELNYTKGNKSRAPKGPDKKTTLGMITRHTDQNLKKDPYYWEIIQGIMFEAAKWRLRANTVFNMHDQKKDWTALRDYAAIAILGEVSEDFLDEVAHYNKNIILVDYYGKNERFDCIQTDFADRTKEILDTLYSYGHRRISYIGGFSSHVDLDGQRITSEHEVRADAYRRWMKLHDLEKYAKVYMDAWGTQSGIDLTERMLSEPEDSWPTAIVAGSDPMAIGVYNVLATRGLSIPDDISIVSFDDIEMARFMTPALSSTHLDANEIGQIIIDLVRTKITGTRKMPIRITCNSRLKLRGSVGKPRK